jgi:WD40 repeat protein
MLAYNDMEGKVGVVELASRRRTVLLAHKDYRFYDPRFSPDGRWIALLGPSGVLIVPFALKPIPEEEWISVGAGGHPQWSPDGRLLYFILPHDGYRCIGAQRLGPSQRPIGLSLPIYHDHTTRRSLGGFVVGRDKLFLSITERTGNIWMAEWK